MTGISRQLEQKSVKRRYYAGDFLPSLDDFAAITKRDVRSVDGYECVDVARTRDVDSFGVEHWLYVALYRRDGTTLEAKAAQEEDRLLDLAAEEQGLVLDWKTPSGDRRDT